LFISKDGVPKNVKVTKKARGGCGVVLTVAVLAGRKPRDVRRQETVPVDIPDAWILVEDTDAAP
jgi:hypothetical protein